MAVKKEKFNFKSSAETVMENENSIALISYEKPLTFKNAELEKVVLEIKKYEISVTTNLFKIASLIHKIYDAKLFIDDGYKNVYEFADKVFGYKKTYVNNMIRVAKDFLIEGENKTIFALDGKDFTMGQLQEFLPLEVKTVANMVDSQEVTFDMTAKDIRKKVNEKRDKAESKKDKKISENEESNNKNFELQGENKEENISEISKLKEENLQLKKENEELVKEKLNLLKEVARLQKLLYDNKFSSQQEF